MEAFFEFRFILFFQKKKTQKFIYLIYLKFILQLF
jgi:hypothetical protein